MKSIVRVSSLATILLGCFFLVGCNSKPAVVGKVSVRGTPLTAGTVTFRSGDFVAGATIQPDGTYSINECPPGQYKVTVEVPNLKFARNTNAVPKAAEMPGKTVTTDAAATVPVAVDSKYRDPNLSGLSYTISSEIRSIDIELQ